jgi:ribose 5-phosphate isomerase A
LSTDSTSHGGPDITGAPDINEGPDITAEITGEITGDNPVTSPAENAGAVAGLNAVDAAKRAAGVRAARMAQPGWVVGLGTGSTAAYAVEELGRLIREDGAAFRGVPTSHAAEVLARRHGIPITTLRDVDRVQLAIDGADEVDPRKNLIKGAGGAHTREKIVASFADLFVVVVDDTKLVARLGQGTAVPLEVIPLAVPAVKRRVREMGGKISLRTIPSGPGRGGPAITDQGNFVLEATFPAIDDPKAMESSLNNLPGVVDNGLFPGMAHLVLSGSTTDGSVAVLE